MTIASCTYFAGIICMGHIDGVGPILEGPPFDIVLEQLLSSDRAAFC